MQNTKKNTIRTIYLYLFTILGLLLLTIGSVGLVNLGLKTWIFTAADKDYYSMQPPMPYGLDKATKISENNEFSEEERALARDWLNDYSSWKENYEHNNYQNAQNHRSAAQNIAMLLIGLPLYLFHWRIIKKENK